MNSKHILMVLLLTLLSQGLFCQTPPASSDDTAKTSFEIQKSAEEWRSQLTDFEYFVLREAGTEGSFSGEYWNNEVKGTYSCKACSLPLFSSAAKYKSGTGWPSFFEPLNDECIGEDVDYKIGYKRTEVHCARCGGHLGHVFPDGPEPTGLRYCINSISLNFEADSKEY